MAASTSDSLLDNIPSNWPVCSFTSIKKLQTEVANILQELQRNNENGNQYLIVTGLNKDICNKLLENHRILPVNYRFMFCESVGLIKVIPSSAHDCTTENVRTMVARIMVLMNIPFNDTQWGQSTWHPGLQNNCGKEPDQCFWPGPRRPIFGQLNGWPTLVIEIGVSESLARLQEDAKWWFHNSQGNTRVVLLLSINKQTATVCIQKWQLMPPETPTPATQNIIQELREENPPAMPPLFPRLPHKQQPYCIQEITLTPTQIIGGLLVLRFEALMDRKPIGVEGDIILDTQALLDCAQSL